MAVEEDSRRLVSAATLLETAIIIEARRGVPGGRGLDDVIQKAEVEMVSIDAGQVTEAANLPAVRQGPHGRRDGLNRTGR